MKKICLAIICVIFLCAISASAFNLKDSLKKLNKMTGSRSLESDIVFKKTCDDIITFSNTSWDMSYNDIKKILLKKNYDIRIESQDLYNLHFVTTKKKCGLNEKSHFHIFMVDDNGKIMIS